MMIPRLAEPEARRKLSWSPAVALIGPRQVGKTTLARQIAGGTAGALYLDLESSEDRARLSEPGLFLRGHRDRLVVLDEVQHLPGLFAELRGEIDDDRRPGRFLILGSASVEMLRQTTESLAGRLALVDMAPVLSSEYGGEPERVQWLWRRGGFPGSLLAADETAAWGWREAFLRSFLYSDLRQLGVGADPDVMHRFLRMIAHLHGQLWNASAVAGSLGVSSPTVARYLDAMTSSLMVRRLKPFHANLGKRLVKSPRVYVRDSGLLHHLLGIRTLDDLIGHPSTGASWEGFVIEQIAAHRPEGSTLSFYRTAAGAELDVLVETGRERIGIEIKFSAAPKPARGFWQACEDLGVRRAFVVAPVRDPYPIAENVDVVGLNDLPALLRS